MSNKKVTKAGVKTPSTKEVGQTFVGLTQQALLQDCKEKDLAMPYRWCVFDTMSQDDAVYTANYVTHISCYEALSRYSIIGKTSKGKANAQFIEYNFKNLESGTFNNMLNDALQILKYGFMPINHVITKRDYGAYKGTYCLSKLSTRDPRSVYAWLWDDNYRECIGFAQHKNSHKYTFSHEDYKSKERYIDFSYNTDSDYTILKSNQYLHFRHNPFGNNPQGDSPYLHCYSAWAEKKVIEKLEVIGITKDLGGAFVVRVPSELVEKASNPTEYPNEYEEYLSIQKDAAKLQNGESSMLVLLSDADPVTGKYLYDLDIKGVDGGGKQYRTSDIISEKRKSIYNVFGAGFLLLGQNGKGSNALFNGADLTHAAFCRKVIDEIADVINSQLIPRILAANGIFPKPKDMPKFTPADIVGISYDEFGKAIQRIKSVNALTPELYEHLLRVANLPIEGIEDIDYKDKGDSRSGESLGTSGTGDTQSGGSNSTLNTENAS